MSVIKRKGIVLAGGSGTRLYPSTKAISKQIIPVYDKPMVYYPISTLMLSGIKDILIISSPDHIHLYKELLGDGSAWGVNFQYKIQPHPGGLAQAFILGEDFIGDDHCALVLGDNIFHGNGLEKLLMEASSTSSPTVFAYRVQDPERFGVVEFDTNKKVISIEEKPTKPKSNYAVTGLYFYDNSVINIAKNLTPSERGELEITDLNKEYLRLNKLGVKYMSRGYAWLDTGTPESLIDASSFIYSLEKRQGTKISCPEEIALYKKWISVEGLKKNIANKKGDYIDYLKMLTETYNDSL
jgi:glucose-1-phosphate thymidylyltransferase